MFGHSYLHYFTAAIQLIRDGRWVWVDFTSSNGKWSFEVTDQSQVRERKCERGWSCWRRKINESYSCFIVSFIDNIDYVTLNADLHVQFIFGWKRKWWWNWGCWHFWKRGGTTMDILQMHRKQLVFEFSFLNFTFSDGINSSQLRNC